MFIHLLAAKLHLVELNPDLEGAIAGFSPNGRATKSASASVER